MECTPKPIKRNLALLERLVVGPFGETIQIGVKIQII